MGLVRNVKRRWSFVVVVCIGLLCIFGIDRIYCNQETARSVVVLDRFTEQLEQKIAGKLAHNMDAAEDMGLFLQLLPTVPDKAVFEKLAIATLHEFPDIIGVGYSDENHISRYWYPEDPQQRFNGINLADTSKYPDFSTVTLKAAQEKVITVNKTPVELPNGVAVFGIRAPLFYGDRFHGLVWGFFVAEKVLQDVVTQITAES